MLGTLGIFLEETSSFKVNAKIPHESSHSEVNRLTKETYILKRDLKKEESGTLSIKLEYK